MLELEKTMYYGATPAIFERASRLRSNMTPAEELLWNKLKGKQVLGLRFRRQHPVSKYIVDFYCHSVKLVIELDGRIHLANTQNSFEFPLKGEMPAYGMRAGGKGGKESDRERTKEIEDLSLCIIRFRNEEVEKDIDNVVLKITKKVQNILNSGE